MARDRTMMRATLVYTAGYPPGIRLFQTHFPLNEPVHVELPKFKIDHLLTLGCERVAKKPRVTRLDVGAIPAGSPTPIGRRRGTNGRRRR